ncbi:MAG: rRNA pseudouridine synthase [Gemmatimonadetes bacterium]|nr:rRNA pseudouridine synthase [Gemmatimonadota bacterium]
MKETLRLNRFLATAGVASRRRCDELIRQGRILVNGRPVEQLGTQVDPDQDEVTVDGNRVELPRGTWTLVLHKPREYLVASGDPRGRKTVMDLLEQAPGRVFPVGRLDYRSEGLLLFTNDGELAYRLAHPRFKVEKHYVVDVEGMVPPEVIEKLREGVVLDDGPTQPADVRLVKRRRGRCQLEVRLREGRKRQIRRMFALFGHAVLRLRRIRFGPIALDGVASGTWRELTPAEIRALRVAVGLQGAGAGERK